MDGPYFDPAQLERLEPYDLIKLRALHGKNREIQNIIAPVEHQSFVKEFTLDKPLLSAALMPYFIPAYTAAKSLNLPFAQGARSDPSLAEIRAGYKGLGQGLLQLGQEGATRAVQPTVNLLRGLLE